MQSNEQLVRLNWIPIINSGRADTSNGALDTRQFRRVVGLQFQNAGLGADIELQFGGCVQIITPGSSRSLINGWPFYDTTVYNYSFINVGAGATKLLIITITQANEDA